MSDALSDKLWVDLKPARKAPEDRVEEALQRALDNTTPERPGVPWEGREERVERGYYIPAGD